MIVPMEKITTLVFHQKKDAFLSSLQELGVVHIALEQLDAQDDKLVADEKKIALCEAFLKDARKISSDALSPAEGAIPAEPFNIVEEYHALRHEIDVLREEHAKLETQVQSLEPWGNFDQETLARLREAGIVTRFFIAPVKKFTSFNAREQGMQEISRDKTHVYFVIFTRGEEIPFASREGGDSICDEFFYPVAGIRELSEQDMAVKASLAEKQKRLQALLASRETVQRFCDQQKTLLAYRSVSGGLRSIAENTVYVVNGWLPRKEKDRVAAFLDEHNVYFYFSAPAPDEAVPVLLKNNRFARLFEAVTGLFDLPNYTELDLTPFFAPFFTLFFGLCLGDAGYGVILAAAAAIFRPRVPENMRSAMVLVMILGGSTAVCGLLCGTLFGADISGLQGVGRLAVFDQDKLFVVALVLGVIQVLFGMCVKVANRVRQYGFLAGLSTIGWIVLILGLLGLQVSPLSQWVAWSGVALILLFNDIKANIFIRLGKGLWELYGITGIFGDVLSYIRLFALGISSSILGFVVNDIALQFKAVPVVGFFLTLLVLVIGHTGNMLLGALSAFVHPLRLTFVEFYKSAGFEGGGKAYNPFRKI